MICQILSIQKLLALPYALFEFCKILQGNLQGIVDFDEEDVSRETSSIIESDSLSKQSNIS